jgi:hypothetical protein
MAENEENQRNQESREKQGPREKQENTEKIEMKQYLIINVSYKNTMNPENKKPISLLTASLDLIKYNAARQPNALKPSPYFIKQQQEIAELVKTLKPKKRIIIG